MGWGGHTGFTGTRLRFRLRVLRLQTRTPAFGGEDILAGVGDSLGRMGPGPPNLDSWVLEVLKGLEPGVFASSGRSIWVLKYQSSPNSRPQIQNSLLGSLQASCS